MIWNIRYQIEKEKRKKIRDQIEKANEHKGPKSHFAK